LRGCAQEIARSCADEDAGTAALTRILITESDRIDRIVSDFLRLNRISEPVLNAVAVAPLLADLAHMIENRPDVAAGLVLTVTVADDCRPLLADGDQARQVLLNLLVNAVEAVADQVQPAIVVTASNYDERVHITVADSGPGLAPVELERAMTPFYSTKSQGTGLGLAVVERIAEEHGALVTFAPSSAGGLQVSLDWPAASLR
jgi:signal transduction histidine kinase